MSASDRKFTKFVCEAFRLQTEINAKLMRSIAESRQRPNYVIGILVLLSLALSLIALNLAFWVYMNQPCDASIPAIPCPRLILTLTQRGIQ